MKKTDIDYDYVLIANGRAGSTALYFSLKATGLFQTLDCGGIYKSEHQPLLYDLLNAHDYTAHLHNGRDTNDPRPLLAKLPEFAHMVTDLPYRLDNYLLIGLLRPPMDQLTSTIAMAQKNKGWLLQWRNKMASPIGRLQLARHCISEGISTDPAVLAYICFRDWNERLIDHNRDNIDYEDLVKHKDLVASQIALKLTGEPEDDMTKPIITELNKKHGHTNRGPNDPKLSVLQKLMIEAIDNTWQTVN